MSLTVFSATANNLKFNENTSNHPQFFDDTEVLVRIDTSERSVALPRNIEVLGGKTNEWLNVIIKRSELTKLTSLGFEYEVLIWDVNAHSQEVAGMYHSLSEMEQLLWDINDAYPDITDLYYIARSIQDRPIWCLEITDNPGVDEGEPGVLYMGLHHAREWPSLEICLNIAEQLTSQYGSNPDITNVVDNRRLWLIPCVNPDGYYYCHDQGHDWRKNRNYFPEFDSWGVDLNRNYGGSSNGEIWGAWGTVGGGHVTHDPDDSLYCGPSAFSERESTAIKNLFIENDICALISWHTHGELVLWPWAYEYIPSPDDSYMSTTGQQIASRITTQSGFGTYDPDQSSELYPTTGDTTDWAYGYAHYVLGRTTFAYTIESCNEFHPSASYLDQIVDENFNGAMFLLQEAETIRDTTVPRVIPPLIDNIPEDNDGDYVVSWQQYNPSANPDKYQLDELTGLTIHTDDVESGDNLWVQDGFTVSTARSHSSSHSLKSHTVSSECSAATSAYPTLVTENMNLSFWIWFDIEANWDFGFVEISKNGRYFDILDSFTGSSTGWEYKEYSLEDYVGDSIYIRFRYATDSYVEEEGFYVDDIYPLSDFAAETTLSNTITVNEFHITDQEPGDYYYRVKGHNAERGWGDLSGFSKISVIDNSPLIVSQVQAIPDSIEPGESINITCSVVGNYDLETVKIRIDGPENFSSVNSTMDYANTLYYYNQTYTIPGEYTFSIWAKDIEGNSVQSAIYQFNVTQVTICGDANGDGAVNVGDTVYLINYVFKGGDAPNPLCIGDANGDEDVNVGDSVYIINYVFKGGAEPVEGCCS